MVLFAGKKTSGTFVPVGLLVCSYGEGKISTFTSMAQVDIGPY